MSKHFTPCPACGAVGEVNSSCQFCGTTILLKEGATPSDTRIIKQRTVTPQQYAEKISIYHKVEPAGNISIVSIGNEYGLINLNGDLIYPLGRDEIRIVNDDTIELGYTAKHKFAEASTKWDSFSQAWRHEDALIIESFNTLRYFNLKTGLYANVLGFVKDKEIPKKLYRVDIRDGWKPINTYINLEGEVHSYDYAEHIVIEHENYKVKLREMYLLHQDNECSLWIVYNRDLDGRYFVDIKLPDKERQAAMNGASTSPMCVLEGLNGEYEFKSNKNKLQIVLRTIKDIDVVLTIASKIDNEHWRTRCFDEIYNEWCIATGKRIAQQVELDEEEDYNDNTVDTQEEGYFWGASKKEWIICLAVFVVWLIVKAFLF